ncbi:alpha-1,2-mannosyltransferase [Saccharopolyspora kobensis]|uniref:Alpha-1,2-mannosyltransferase n=1 Tax=Saccharopolyspora kobensis TaxID=146035 RepID=A0A1H6DSE9_9PSEU|nr:alpha-1,2-mannosyltransferase [Saccharopolyspora kobensis]SFE01791.1 alpha-1,2-mannosyltransferase [Saccharopolyspora kobensis]
MQVTVSAGEKELSPRLRWLSRHVVAVVVLSAAVFAVPSLLHWAFTGQMVVGDFLDITVYRAGGAALLHGEPLYEADLRVAVGSFPFTYTPFAAVLFTPLALIPAWLCQALVIPSHIALLAAVVWRCLRCIGHHPDRELRRAAVAITAVLFVLEPITWTMWLGQINLLLLAVVLFDLTARGRWSGVGLGIATGIKLTPGLFIVYLLCTRRFRAAAAAAITAAATTGAGFLIAPEDSARYWGGTFLDNTRFSETDGSGNLSINGLIARLVGVGDAQRVVWLICAIAVVALGIGLAAVARARGHELFGLTLCGLTATAVSPFSWSHHWVWIAPLAVLAIRFASPTAIAGLLALTFAWPVHVLFGLDIHFPVLGISAVPPWQGVEILYGNAYLLVFAGALAAGHQVRARARTQFLP